MKKFLSIVLALSMFMLVACSNNTGEESSQQSEQNISSTQEAVSSQNEQISSTQVNDEEITSRDITGYWVHTSGEMYYHLDSNGIFEYKSAQFGQTGSFDLNNYEITIYNGPESSVTGFFDEYLANLVLNTIAGEFYRAAPEEVPQYNHEPDISDFNVFGSWTLFGNETFLTFYDDGTYLIEDSVAIIDNGHYTITPNDQLTGAEIEFLSEHGSVYGGYYSIVTNEIEVDDYGTSFVKGEVPYDEDNLLIGAWLRTGTDDTIEFFSDYTFTFYIDGYQNTGTYKRFGDEFEFTLYDHPVFGTYYHIDNTIHIEDYGWFSEYGH